MTNAGGRRAVGAPYIWDTTARVPPHYPAQSGWKPFLLSLRLQKRFARSLQSFFQPFGAIAVAASPGLHAVLVTAVFPRVCIFHAEQVEIFFPVRPFLRQRRIAKTGLDPDRNRLFVHACLLHVVQVFVPGYRTFPERLIFDRPNKCGFLSGFYLCFY